MRPSAFRLYLILGALLIAPYLALPAGFFRDVVYYCGVGLVGCVAIVAATRRRRPSPCLPWCLFAAGQLLFVLGDLLFGLYEHVLHEEPFPSWADVLYLSGYPVLALAFALLVRSRSPRRDWASLIDASIITVGLAVLGWTFLMVPYASDPTLSLAQRLISIAYPLGDVLLLAVAVRLLVGAGTRNASYRLLGAAVVAILVADVFYGLLNLAGAYEAGGPIDLGWLASYVLFGAAALHPSMGSLSERAPEQPPKLKGVRLSFLAAASLTGPAVLGIRGLPEGGLEMPALVGGTSLLFLLVLVRMTGVVSSHKRVLRRESLLRQAAGRFVAASDRPGIYRTAVETAVDFARGLGEPQATLALGTEEERVVIAAAGAGAAALEGTVLRNPLRGPHVGEPGTAVHAGGGTGNSRSTTTFPIVIQGEIRGALGVGTETALPPELHDALTTLAAQTALALESSALAEDRHLRQSERRFRALVQHSSDVIAVVDPDLTIRYASASVDSVLGRDPAELVGRSLRDLLAEGDVPRAVAFYTEVARRPGLHAPVELRLRHGEGALRDVEVISSNLLDEPNVNGLVLTIRDVTERRALERQLTHQAFHDPLTGLANRALFLDRVQHALVRRQAGRTVSIVFLDLDDFKTVNDSLGHAAGDELLVAVAERLSACLRPGDTSARLGGDEFAILLEGARATEAGRAATRVLEALQPPFHLHGKEVSIRGSAGIASGGDVQVTADELLRNADAAMYHAKHEGKDRLEVFEPNMHEAAVTRLELKAELERAIEHEELVLHYQPIVDLRTGEIDAVEALVRWRRPNHGIVPPGAFIPLAEETGLIVPIGRWVLEEACRQVRAWQKHRARPLTLSVNLSGRQLAVPGIVDTVAATLECTTLAPSSLMLEITETVLMQTSLATIGILRELQGMGVRLAIDDFGTGYSSLSYLEQFPIDTLKVAKAFVDGAGRRGEERRLAGAIFGLGRTLGLRTVGEGVESPEQHSRLLELGCDLGQGFLYAGPLDAQDFDGLLRELRAGRRRLVPFPSQAAAAGAAA